jgi:hypothetical protein
MTDLSYSCKWDSVIALDDWLGSNRYKCKVYFDIETDDGEQQNIAFERCKILMEAIFNQGLFISMTNPLLQILAKKTKQKIITLPTEPLDVILAAVLYHKLNAISEGRLNIHEVKISSIQGDNIWVHFDEDFANDFGSLDSEYYKAAKETPWWHRADPSTSDWFELSKKEMKFHFQKTKWEKSLLWDQEKTEKDSKTTANWKPQVINGGKDTKH